MKTEHVVPQMILEAYTPGVPFPLIESSVVNAPGTSKAEAYTASLGLRTLPLESPCLRSKLNPPPTRWVGRSSAKHILSLPQFPYLLGSNNMTSLGCFVDEKQ